MRMMDGMTPDYVVGFFKRACPALLVADEEAQLEEFERVQPVGGNLDVDVLIPAEHDMVYMDMKLKTLANRLKDYIDANPGKVFAITKPSVVFSTPQDRHVRRCDVDSTLYQKAA